MKRSTVMSELVKALGAHPLTLVDVGARWGADKRWRLLGDCLTTIGFEPDPEECRRLNEKAIGGYRAFPVALSNRVGKCTLNVAEEPGRSSLYRPHSSLLTRYPDHGGFSTAHTLDVPATTLDLCLGENGISTVDFIKLDVQGSELNIIEGGREIIRDTVFGLEVEVEFSELYQGQPLFADIDHACQEAGFTLFDMKPCYWKRTQTPIRGVGQMVCGDALYFKDYIQDAMLPSCRDAAAAILISVVYQKYDYALELLSYFHDHKMFSREVVERSRRLILGMARLRFPLNVNFRGRLRVANFLDTLSQKLKTSYWARWDDWKI